MNAMQKTQMLWKALAESTAQLQETNSKLKAVLQYWESTLDIPSGTASGIYHARPISSVSVINGKKAVVEDYNENAFDVVVNGLDGTLKSRQDPAARTALMTCNMKGLGSSRMRLLIYMLEHPRNIITTRLADSIYPDSEGFLENSALRKTISILRKALGHGLSDETYLATRPFLLSSEAGQRGYILNKNWKYLLIRK